MSGEFSTYGATAILDATALPATLYLKPHIGNPGSGGTANAAGETNRRSFTRAAAVAGATTNVAVLQWNGVAANETWTHWSAWDHATAGNCWMVGALAVPVVVVIGNIVEIAAGDADFSITIWT